MLEREGFQYEKYVDIFDGGPTMIAPTDRVRTIESAADAQLAETREGGEDMLVATGRFEQFRAAYAKVTPAADGTVTLDPAGARALSVAPGDTLSYVAR